MKALTIKEEANIITFRKLIFKDTCKAAKIIYKITYLQPMDIINNPYHSTQTLIKYHDEIMEALKNNDITI